jgi:hypothetical protein
MWSRPSIRGRGIVVLPPAWTPFQDVEWISQGLSALGFMALRLYASARITRAAKEG